MTNPNGSPTQRLLDLVRRYGSVEAVPAVELQSAGFNVTSAHNTLNLLDAGKAQLTGQSSHGPDSSAYTIEKQVSNNGNFLAKAQPAGMSIGDAIKAMMPTSFVGQTSPAAQQAAATNPIAGGVQYGTPANGSTLGAPHGASPDVTTQVTGAPNYSDFVNGDWQFAPIPNAPDAPNFKMNDFTPQASKMAATAYSPAFAAIDSGEQQAKDNYAYADQVVKGLYADQAQNIDANTAVMDQQYKDTTAGVDTRNTQSQQATTDAYGASQDQMAQVLKAQGLGDQAQTQMEPAAADEAFQKGQLQQIHDITAGGLDRGKQSADTAQAAAKSASVNEGSVQRQNLSHDLTNTLTDYGQYKLNLTADEAQKVLDLSSSLSSQDLSLQQANYGGQQDRYQNQLAAAQMQNQNVSTQQAGAQSAYDAAYKNWYDTQNLGLQNAQIKLGAQQEIDNQTNNAADRAATQANNDANRQNNLDVASIQAGATAAGMKPPDTGIAGEFINTVKNWFPGDDATAGKYVAAMQKIQVQMLNQGVRPDAQNFAKEVMNQATQNGIDPNIAFNIAMNYANSGMLTGLPSAKSLGQS